MTHWWDGPLVGFDLETTDRDPLSARVVTATLLLDVPGEVHDPVEWLVKTDDPIPEEATAVHGVTTERSQAEGRDPRSVIVEISDLLHAFWMDGVPVVVYNAPYDFTVLAAERRRYELPEIPLTEPPVAIVDPLVIDRGVDRYRKGSRQLGDTARFYGVQLQDAHTSTGDAGAAVGVARALGRMYPQKLAGPMTALWAAQQHWCAQWAAGYGAYIGALVDGSWPVRELPGSGGSVL